MIREFPPVFHEPIESKTLQRMNVTDGMVCRHGTVIRQELPVGLNRFTDVLLHSSPQPQFQPTNNIENSSQQNISNNAAADEIMILYNINIQ